MMDHLHYKRPHLYQSANADDEKIKENFLIRLNEYDIIIKDILKYPMKGSIQHYLLIGRRGSGKSTLLKRLQIEISSNAALKDKYIPINLAEEQANIYKLYDLLEEITNELEHHGITGTLPEWEDDTHKYARKLFDNLHELIEKSGKKVILLLDNIDRIFENIGEETSLLREYLLNYDDIRIIGGSTRMTEHFWAYSQPFYQFFRVLELEALTTDEVKLLLLHWSEKMDLPQLKEFVETRSGQLETIRLLTDGLPRTLQFFVNILLTNTQETGYEYLRYVMDNVTPLYQERLNSLPPSQRKIVLQLAFIWEAAGTGKLAEVAKMNNNVISAQLKQLAEKGIVEKIESGNKNHLYRLAERFFNLWLIFTQGNPKEKRKAKYLTIFLENFYDGKQIRKLAAKHLKALNNGSISPDKAALLTKAFAQSRHINYIDRDRLINQTLELDNIPEDVKNQLPPTIINTLSFAKDLIQKRDFDHALKVASSIEQDHGIIEYVQGLVHVAENKLEDAAIVFLTSIKKGFSYSNWLLATVYDTSEKYALAEKYYLKSMKYFNNNSNVTFDLGKVYLKQKKYQLAKEQFSKIAEPEKEFLTKIGEAYFESNELEEAEFFLQKGVDARVPGAATRLALIFYSNNIRKREALDLIEMDRQGDHAKTNHFNYFEIIISIWAGNFLNIKGKAIYVIENSNDDLTRILLTDLLVHNQYNIVYQIFEFSDMAISLRERFLPLYYATLILSQPQEKTALIIPPEIYSTVIEIIEGVRATKNYFDGKES